MDRAFSCLEIKSVDEDRRIIRGIATRPTPDRLGDIVESEGAEFKLPIPLLSHHDRTKPIGHVLKAKVKSTGIEVEAQIAQVDEAGPLRDRLDEAWQEIKSGLVRGLSIGFKPLEAARIEGTFGTRFLKWLWLELSAVVIPAHEDASILTIKSYGASQAAIGRSKTVQLIQTSPGVSGHKAGAAEMNIQEHIKHLTNTRAAKAAALEAIMRKSVESGETMDADERKLFDETEAEVKALDEELKRADAMLRIQAAQAKEVRTLELGNPGEDPSKKAAEDRDPLKRVVTVERKLEKGIQFARFAGIVACAKGNMHAAVDIARDRFPSEKPLHDVLKMIGTRGHEWVSKAAVDVGTSRDTDYAAPLVNYTNMVADFIEYLRPMTIIGRIPNLRRVPFNIRVPRQTGGGAAAWVGEGAPKPVTAVAFDYVELKYTKLATIAVITEELARFSSPSAEQIIRDTLAGAIVQQMDSDFVNPSNAGTSNVKPASITNGVSAVPSVGNTEAEIRLDIGNVFAPFITANLTPANGVWIMSATTALALSLVLNDSGTAAFPDITMSGGTFFGMPVVVSEAVGNIVILANASDILLADDGQATIDVSREASVQMDDAPTNPVVAATVLVSLWQHNLIGIRAERMVNWIKARSASVQYLSGVNWGQTTT
jgi:HK97 family phage major capsid protein